MLALLSSLRVLVYMHFVIGLMGWLVAMREGVGCDKGETEGLLAGLVILWGKDIMQE